LQEFVAVCALQLPLHRHGILPGPIGEIILRLKISELEAQLVLCEIERVGLSRQIEGPDFDLGERDRAVVRRERVVVEWGEIMVELYELRERYPRELELTPRAKMNYGRGPGERRALNHERAFGSLRSARSSSLQSFVPNSPGRRRRADSKGRAVETILR